MSIIKDIDFAITKDAALTSRVDALFNCPGLHAIWIYRVYHKLWSMGLRPIARLMSTIARMVTGVEIHPAAQIGSPCYIDHGTGVVIGQTAIIGNEVVIYHGVTFGAVEQKIERRHPCVGNRVVLGAGAKILGSVNIGDDARVGANAVVTKDVPAGTTVVGIPARPLSR